jgi:hypothetical protein
MWLEDERLGARFLIHDRDTKFSKAFRLLFRNTGIRPLKTSLLAPDANSLSEAWIGGLKRESLDYFLCFSLGHLNHIGQEFVKSHHTHRPHQGLGNLTLPTAATGPPEELVSKPEAAHSAPARMWPQASCPAPPVGANAAPPPAQGTVAGSLEKKRKAIAGFQSNRRVA